MLRVEEKRRTLMSFEHRLLFVRPAKVAGTSVEMLFQSLLWPAVEVTHQQRRRCFSSGFVTARMTPSTPVTRRQRWMSRWWAIRYRRLGGGRWLDLAAVSNHSPPARIRTVFGETLWANTFKFTIVRNFYDVEVSRYFWRCRGKIPSDRSAAEMDFESFVLATGPAKTNARVVDHLEEFDFIINFGDLMRDLQRLVSQLGFAVEVDGALPREKTALRPEWASDYREMYTGKAQRAVQAKYAAQLEKTGQAF